MKRILMAAGALVGMMSAQPANANVWCTGTIDSVVVNAQGVVFAKGSWRNEFTQICSVSSAWGAIQPNTCVTWLAQLDAAVTLGTEVVLQYPDGTDCSTLPAWASAPAPQHVRLNRVP